MGTLVFLRSAHLTLKIGATAAGTYHGQVSQAAVEVEPGDTVTYPVLDGTVPTQIGASSYALHLVAAQDWDTTGTPVTGLAAFLWQNEGAQATFYLTAYGTGTAPSTSKPAVTGTVTLVAGTYGGEVNTYPEIDVTLPCNTKPTLATTGTIPTLSDVEPEPLPGTVVQEEEPPEVLTEEVA